MSNLFSLRWWFFKRRQAGSEKLPPTSGACREAILRTHYQLLVWNQDKIAKPTLPSPKGYGWKLEGDKWERLMTKHLRAPHAVIHLVKHGCTKFGCSCSRCSCKNENLRCTDLCSYSDSDMECANYEFILSEDDSGCASEDEV